MAEYIDITEIFKGCSFIIPEKADAALTVQKLLEHINSIPAADVAEVKHAYYEVVPNQHKNQAVPDVRCSNCQRVLKRKKENYCPHCGAKMDGIK